MGPVLRLSMTPILGTHTQLVHPKRWEWMWDCDPITESVQRWPVSSNNPRFVWNSGSVYMVRFETICLLYVDLTYINKREQILQKTDKGVFSQLFWTLMCSVLSIFFLKSLTAYFFFCPLQLFESIKIHWQLVVCSQCALRFQRSAYMLLRHSKYVIKF